MSCEAEIVLSPGLQLIADIVPDNSKVLDLGCGDGVLLDYLRKYKSVKGWGVDIDYENILCCIKRGIPVFQGDIEEGLQDFHNDLYDYVIISQTMQEIRSLEKLLLEALRIGNRVIVTFPNFAYFVNRMMLFFRGRSPVTSNLPYAWYESPNVHFFSIVDFQNFCFKNDIQILHDHPYCDNTSTWCRSLTKINRNLFAQHNLVVISNSLNK